MSNNKGDKTDEKTGKNRLKRISKKEMNKTLLLEIAWEVCNQVGGIYTVIRSKIPSVMSKWNSENYCLLGPYVHENVTAVFDPIEDYEGPIGRAVQIMRENGHDVHYGYWLVSGRPKVVLFNPYHVYDKLDYIKHELWEHHNIPSRDGDKLLDQILAFGYLVKEFLHILAHPEVCSKQIIAHFHEWMAGTPIPAIRRSDLPITTVFTTHATLLGRYLAMNDPVFYEYMPFYDWEKEAKHFYIEPSVKIERAAAHGCHVFTTVSEVTAKECLHLLGREVDVVLPNGINIERFEALHEFQNLHLEFKEKIHQFVMGHFFQSYTFDLDKTIYFFTSGRFEYQNKGFDLTLEALARLNWMLKEANIDVTIVTFFITRQPYTSINPQVLQSRGVMEEIRQTCDAIQQQLGERLFYKATTSQDHKLPKLNDLVDDYMKLRLRRTIQSWKSIQLPSVVTHNLVDDKNDPILNFLRSSDLVNKADDKVKVVYHPDFISPTNPLFGMEYGQFVRGCHLGVFPSYYEPWGYTPLECVASGLPTVTSDLSGFGDYVLQSMGDYKNRGIYVVKRRHGSFDQSAAELAEALFKFAKANRRERIAQRNRVEGSSVFFDWDELGKYYDQAYKVAVDRRYSE